jgi:hypothetical protein
MLAGAVLAAVLVLAGCGSNNDGQVSGTVKLDDTPIETGSITFVPVDGKTTTAGGPIKAGRYSVKVPVGKMKVSISMPRVVGKKKIYNTPDSPEMPVTKEGVPEQYNEKTELTFDVQPGGNEKNWDLKSK